MADDIEGKPLVIGLGSMGWMLALGAVTAIEKSASWGRRVARPLGVVLLLAGLSVVNGW